jgi:hypothetical protein
MTFPLLPDRPMFPVKHPAEGVFCGSHCPTCRCKRCPCGEWFVPMKNRRYCSAGCPARKKKR